MIYRIGTYEQCIADDMRISQNCGYPKNGTTNWAVPRETMDTGVWAYPDFPLSGRDDTTYEQATDGVACPIGEAVFPEVGDE